MKKYIKYKRETAIFNPADDDFEAELQDFYDQIIIDGFEIIYYNEDKKMKDNLDHSGKVYSTDVSSIKITVILGKKQDNRLITF